VKQPRFRQSSEEARSGAKQRLKNERRGGSGQGKCGVMLSHYSIVNGAHVGHADQYL
jgi:hypothetical protein